MLAVTGAKILNLQGQKPGALYDHSRQVLALSTALALASFPASVRAEQAAISPSPEHTLSESLSSSIAATQQVVTVSPVELQGMISRIVADEIARSQTNGASILQLEKFAEILSSKLTRSSQESAPPTNAWAVSKALSSVEKEITKKIGWNSNTVISAVSSTLVVGTALWLISLSFFRRYPNEFETKIADLGSRDPTESYGVEPLFGRTEVDVLLGKPKAMSNRLLNIFLPEKWKLTAAQLSAKFHPEFPFLRFQEGRIFESLASFLKINASTKPLLKQSMRDAHERLAVELKRVEGPAATCKLNPLRDGEEAVAVITYERWNRRINRALIAPCKDLCALLINPCRFYDHILLQYEEFSTPAARKQISSDLIGLMRKLELAAAILERSPAVISRYLDRHFPKCVEKVHNHARELRPLLVLNTPDSMVYVTRYMLELEQREDVAKLAPSERRRLHEVKKLLLQDFINSAQHGRSREFGVLHEAEQRRLEKLWSRQSSPMLSTVAYLLSALRWLGSNKTWAEVKPVTSQRASYHWFSEVHFPDPSL